MRRSLQDQIDQLPLWARQRFETDEVFHRLLSLLCDSFWGEYSAEQIVDRLELPSWQGAGKVHDWRNHVPDEIKTMWSELPTEVRLTVILMARHAAEAEEWD